MDAIGGSCLCGAVRFEVTPPVKWVANCHCTLCRRANAAPFVTWASFPSERVTVTAGELVTYHSSERGLRRFCRTCGSQVFFEGTKWPGEIHVTRALLPDGAELPLPMAHSSWDNRAPWLHLEDELRKIP